MFEFLHKVYFPRVIFGPVYLSGIRTRAFVSTFELLRFERSQGGLHPSAKHRKKIEEMPIARNHKELDAFLWLTSFLRIFISGRASHVMKLKEAYLIQLPKPKKEHIDLVEECELDLTKSALKKRNPKTIVRKM